MKSSFEIAGLRVEPGQRRAEVLELVCAGVPLKMPLYVLNGAGEGPTLVVTAGIHGAEYVGIEAALRLAQRTDPQALRGQLVVAPIASQLAFAKRAIYICPPDGKNLNRCFPGNPAGTFAEQLADWIFTNLIRHADFYLDLHGGDMNEALIPFSIVRRSGNAALDDRSLALSQAFGLPYVVGSVVRGSTYAAATELGIPSVLAEVGGQGLWPEDQVRQMSEGLARAMRHLGLSSQTAPPAPPTRLLEEMHWLRSEHDGLFYPQVAVGERVEAGQALGRVADYLGNSLQAVVAPADGVVLFLVTMLAMNQGDPLLAVGA
ncbi:MAG: succinylglutamate desuccinylase/aspartoacylase family protein [Chloroflexi bacterium]|nr:succinylglutamate desuccinylase/aspartoacylase family protein [Chloroflexota bacterium]